MPVGSESRVGRWVLSPRASPWKWVSARKTSVLLISFVEKKKLSWGTHPALYFISSMISLGSEVFSQSRRPGDLVMQ